MKIISKISVSIGLSLLAIGAMAQSPFEGQSVPMPILNTLQPIKQVSAKSAQTRAKSVGTGASTTAYLNYEYVDSSYTVNNTANTYLGPTEQMLNSRYTLADTTITPFTFTHAYVAFDTMYDANVLSGTPSNDVVSGSLTVDSVQLAFSLINKSGKTDTVQIQVVGVDGTGFPNSTVYATETFTTTTSTNARGQFTRLNLNTNATAIPGNGKFAVELSYYGSKLDTFDFVFGYPAVNCSGTRYADTTAFGEKYGPNGNMIRANSFTTGYGKYNPPTKANVTLPNATYGGGLKYYTCVGSNPLFWQDIYLSAWVSYTSTALSASISAATSTCSGTVLTASASGPGSPYTYSWSTGASTSSITAIAAGTYTVSVTNTAAVTATASVNVSYSVLSSVKDSVAANGSNAGIAAVIVSGGVTPYTYLWSPGGQTTDSISGLSSGNYCCAITDNNGCSQTVCINVPNFFSCTNSYTEPICIVTIDTATNKSEVIWGRTNSPPARGFGTYNVYKDNGSGYILIHSQALDSLSEFIDTTSSPSVGVQSYELSTVDSCGESALSTPSSSIFLTTTKGTNTYSLTWTPYVGFTPSEYRIFRGLTMSQLTQIDSVPNNVYRYTDSFPPINVFYVLEAVNPSGSCIPTTHGPKNHNLNISLLSGAFSNGFNTAILGVQNIGDAVSKLNIYPNPSNGIVTLSYNMNGSDNVQITIIDELGRVVYEEQKNLVNGTNTEQLNLVNLSSGIYSLRMQTNSGITVRKLVIMGN